MKHMGALVTAFPKQAFGRNKSAACLRRSSTTPVRCGTPGALQVRLASLLAPRSTASLLLRLSSGCKSPFLPCYAGPIRDAVVDW